jgi:hypothetical protein
MWGFRVKQINKGNSMFRYLYAGLFNQYWEDVHNIQRVMSKYMFLDFRYSDEAKVDFRKVNKKDVLRGLQENS